MLAEKMQQAVNGQLNREYYSAYLYLSMAAYFESVSLPGFANWMRVQVQEELVHATKFYDYINNRRGKVLLQAIEAPPSEWESPQAAFQHAYQHEQGVTGRINNLVNLALEIQDHATHNFLQWFISEQVEEEASTDEVLRRLKLLGEAPGGLFMIDRELAQRVFTMPPPTAGGTTK